MVKYSRVTIAYCGEAFEIHEHHAIANTLLQTLTAEGVVAEVAKLPYFKDSVSRLQALYPLRWLHYDASDLLITLGTPAHFIPHRNKVVCFLNSEVDVLFNQFETGQMTAFDETALQYAYSQSLAEAQSLYAENNDTAARLRSLCGKEVITLEPDQGSKTDDCRDVSLEHFAINIVKALLQ